MQTTNYNQFKFFTSNRQISQGKVKRFIKSFNDIGYIKSMPVTVTPNYEIIDGQHRFKACQELGMPIIYSIIDSKINPDKLMIELNKNNDTWRLDEYIHHHSINGIKFFIELKNYMIKYKFGASNSIYICAENGVNSSTLKRIKEGIDMNLYNKRDEFAYYIKSMDKLAFYLSGHFVKALLVFYKKSNTADKKKLIEKCLLISKQGDVSEYKRIFMNIVNKGKNQENYLIL